MELKLNHVNQRAPYNVHCNHELDLRYRLVVSL